MDSSGVIDRAKCFEVTTGCGDFKSLDREQEKALLIGAWEGGGGDRAKCFRGYHWLW